MKKNIKLSIFFVVLAFSMSMISCGGEDSKGNSNIYNHISIKGRSIQGSEEDFIANKAVAYMNAGKVDEAIKCLEEFLNDNPNSKLSKSVLSTAYMQKSGIDLLSIVTKIVDRGGVAANGNYNDLVSVVSDIVGDFNEDLMVYMEKAEALIKDLEATSTLDEYNRLKKMITGVVLVSFNVMSIAEDFKAGFKDVDLENITQDVVDKITEELVNSKEAIEDIISTSSLSEEEVDIIKKELDNFYNEISGDEGIDVSQLQEYIKTHYKYISEQINNG